MKKKLKNKLRARLPGQDLDVIKRALNAAMLAEDPFANRKTRRAMANKRTRT